MQRTPHAVLCTSDVLEAEVGGIVADQEEKSYQFALCAFHLLAATWFLEETPENNENAETAGNNTAGVPVSLATLYV